ncbi:MAG: FHA domain-containing protein [Alphaproteobacteria bacterium]|nr:FHA domain-containing protein [Alphaproteobacteria bacterium]MCB9690590.1 FHA domain-containing protein [Alphaproteobacteria bacterium]
MVLWATVALAGRGAVWVDPPSVSDGVLAATVRLEEDVDPAALELLADDAVLAVTTRRAEDGGSTTLLAFDASGSFRGHYAKALGLATPLAARVDADHAMGLMVFGRQTHASPVTNDPAAFRAQLDAARAGEAVQKETRLAAALLDGLDRLVDARPSERGGLRRLVVFTDAGEESSVFSPDEVVKAAHDRHVRVDLVVFARSRDPSFAEDLDRLTRIARATGGRVLEVHDHQVDDEALLDLWARPSGLFALSAPVCGDRPPAVVVRGPAGVTTDVVPLAGPLVPCAKGAQRAAQTSTRPAPGSARAATKPASRAAGLLCLLATAATFVGLLGVALWLARRNAAPPAPPAPIAPPPPDPPPPEPTPPEPPPEIDEKPVFSMRLPETHLVVVGGDLPRGTRWRFAGRILRVGANPEENDVVVDLPQVSGAHARFELFPSGAVFVEDLGSSNGTWVDGERLRPGARAEVARGAKVALSSQLTVSIDGTDVSRA